MRFHPGVIAAASGGGDEAVLAEYAFQTETNTLATSFASAPSDKRKRTIDRCIKRLKDAGVWDKATALYLVGANEDASLKNWKTPGTYNLTKVGAPTFTADDGWQATGTGQYLNTNLSLDGLSAANCGHYGWSKTDGQSSNWEYGVTDTGFRGVALRHRDTQDRLFGRCFGGDTQISTLGHATGIGLAGMSRTISTSATGWYNGVSQLAGSTNATATTSRPIYLLTLNSAGTASANYSTRKQSMWYFGQALTETECRALTGAVGDYLETLEYGEPELYEAGFDAATVTADCIAYGTTGQSILFALQAARAGASVAICGGWRDRHFGGMSGGGLGYSDFENHASLGGLPRWIITRMNELASKADTSFLFEPQHFRAVMRELLDPAKNGGYEIPVYWSNGVSTVTKSGAQITQFTTADGRTFTGTQFFDGSYEGDLLVKAGVDHIIGREAAGSGKESMNGYRGLATADDGALHQFKNPADSSIVNIDPWTTPGDTASGLLPGVQGIYSTFTPALHDQPAVGAADSRMQAYNFRLTMTTSTRRRVPLPSTPPAGYDVGRYELLLRYLEAVPTAEIVDIFKPDLVSGSVYDVNAKWGFSTDLFGENHDYISATYAERETIWKDHWNFILGMWYLLQHGDDVRIPAALQTEAQDYGFVRDHYYAPHPNDVIFEMPQLYVREGARMVSDVVMNGNHMIGQDDTEPSLGTKTVSTASYPMDSHTVQRIADEYEAGSWRTWLEGGFFSSMGGTDETAPVPYDICVPKASECTNLSVGFNISATHVAFGSIRMEFTAMQIGQSMGHAAALAVGGGTTIQNVDYDTLRTALLASPAYTGEVAPVLPQVN